MVDKDNLNLLCESVHKYIQLATQDMVPPSEQDTALVRKKMSVFTFGICTAIATQESVDCGELYYQFLLKGGLNSHAARVVVERTSMEFAQKEYGEKCFNAGKKFANNQNSTAEKIELNISELLLNK